MDLKDRLKIFINCSYKNIKQFSEYSDVEYTRLCKYLKGLHSPTEDSLLNFYKSGINVCWLLSGEGSMFASNQRGEELRRKHKVNHPDYEIDKMKTRIKKWIEDQYGTIGDFANEMNIETKKIELELEDFTSASPEFITLINNAGCNINWAVSGKGPIFSNNASGLIFLSQKKGIPINKDDIKEEEIEPQLKSFYNVMRKAVRDEMKKIEKEK